MIIAIDGPAGAGKSTVCKILAQKLCFLYLDTGAMYRAAAWALIEETGGLPEGATSLPLSRIPLFFRIADNRLEISYREKVLADELRNPEISDAASRISQLQPVRTFLVSWQRKLGRQGNIVAEGRDTATVVFPDAELKVFLTADLPTRIDRRLAEYREKGINTTFQEMEKRIRERDEADATRDLSPMRPAPGALIVDTSLLSIPEVVDQLIDVAGSRMKADCTINHTDLHC